MDPSIIVAVLALAGVLVTAVATFRKDKREIEGTAYAKGVDAAIAGLNAAFEVQKQLTIDCRGECAQLREDNDRLREDLTTANTKLDEALGKIRELEAIVRGTT